MDLALAVTIVGVLAAVATPRFFASLDAHRSRAAARKVAADLEHLRQRAIASSRAQTARFTPGTSTYSLDGVPDPAHPTQTWTVVLSASPWHAELSSLSFGVGGVVQFDHNGLPNQGGTLVVSSGGSQTVVAVDSTTGRVSVP